MANYVNERTKVVCITVLIGNRLR